jgi:hypothetical protein
MTVPATSWDETSPAGTQSRALGDDRIREMKAQIREVVGVDHKFESSGQHADMGKHNKVTFLSQGSDPLPDTDAFILFSKDVSAKSELHFIDEDGNTMQLTSGGQFVGGMQYEVRMWSGLTSAIPTGWVLCDGNNSTPNLTSKFVRGVATISERVFTPAGADTHTHTINNHTHTIAHTHTYSGTTGTEVEVIEQSLVTYYGDSWSPSKHTHSFSGTTGETSVATSGNPSDRGMDTISNIPAYVALAFIMKS